MVRVVYSQGLSLLICLLLSTSSQVTCLALTTATESDRGSVTSQESESRYHRASPWKILFQSASSPHENFADTLSVECPDCGARKAQAQANLNEKQLTALRIELTKQQILEKLRLREPPKNTLLRSTLPKLLANGTFMHKDSAKESSLKDVDDFYGKTDQVILFPHGDVQECNAPDNGLGACLTFNLPASLMAENGEITSAELWVHKRSSTRPSKNHNETIIVKEVGIPHVNKPGDDDHHPQLIVIMDTTVKEGWLKINLIGPVASWIRSSGHNLTLHISCSTCAESTPVPFSLQHDLKPFLAVNTRYPPRLHRSKRNVNCAPGTKECCRDHLYVSFKDIGWGDWILQPEGYNAYFCRGTCTNAASITQSGSYYSSVIQNFLFQGNLRNRKIGLTQCCTPTKLSALQILYIDNNDMIVEKTLPAMVVESCGCM